MSDLPALLPWESFDPDHADHDSWFEDTGRCFAPDCERHQEDPDGRVEVADQPDPQRR